MVKAKEEEQALARELRKQGWSYTQIADELEVSKGSVHNWCKDIELSPEQKKQNREKQIQRGKANKGAQKNKEDALLERKEYQESGRIKARERSRLHMIGCMLYWAEGAKSSRNVVQFANSDSHMILIFAEFLRKELDVLEDMIKVQVHCHTNVDEERIAIENYWLNLLHIPRENLYKTQVVKSSGKSRNRLEYGVCSIIVNSTELLHHIFGSIQEYGDFNNEDWLY